MPVLPSPRKEQELWLVHFYVFIAEGLEVSSYLTDITERIEHVSERRRKIPSRVGVCVCQSVMSSSFKTPLDCSPPCSSVHEIIQARILERVAIPFSRGSS